MDQMIGYETLHQHFVFDIIKLSSHLYYLFTINYVFLEAIIMEVLLKLYYFFNEYQLLVDLMLN